MLTWFFLLVFLAIAVAAGGLAARSYMTGEPLAGFFSRPRSEPRLSVVEQTSVDNRRKLLLVRRDGVEHLIMTGGPVDVVIETGIGAPAASANSNAVAGAALRNKSDSESSVTSTPVFGRQARSLGQVVNE
jgi:flagellar protein FliO/FliZ